jgi:flagellar biosynthetic protein FliQ
VILDITRDAVFTVITTSAPLLLVSLAVGLIISIFQTVTSIQEQTLTFVPKILAVFVTLMICGSWMLTNLTEMIDRLWTNFGQYLNG